MRFLPLKQIVVHHAVITGDAKQFDDVRYQHEKKGLGQNTAYHFFVEKDGTIETGRPLSQISAGTLSRIANHNGIHVCFAGNFEIEEPTEAQIYSLRALASQYDFPVVGHREVSASLCPGKNLFKIIQNMNNNLLSETILLFQRLWERQNDEDKKKIAELAQKIRVAQKSLGLPVSR